MCTFKDERTALICDVAIGQVKQDLEKALGDRVRYTPIQGKGTLVEAVSGVDGSVFSEIVRAAIAEV